MAFDVEALESRRLNDAPAAAYVVHKQQYLHLLHRTPLTIVTMLYIRSLAVAFLTDGFICNLCNL
jgi:hypothetical protein